MKTAAKKNRKILAAAIVAGMILVIYLAGALYFHSRFLPGTTINDLAVGGKTQAQTEQMLTDEIRSYKLTVQERGDQTETIQGTDISIRPQFGDSIAEKIRTQNSFAWPAAFFSSKEIEEETVVEFDEDALRQKMKDLDCMQAANQKEPKDAYCSDYVNGGYEIIPEEEGSTLMESQVFSVLEDAVGNLTEEVSLEKEDCYKKPSVTAETQSLKDLVDTLNRYVQAKITYKAGDKTEVLDKDTIHTWLKISGTQVSIDEDAVSEYMTKLASAFNTAFKGHSLKTSYGTTVQIPNGDYGWKIDKDKEKEQLLSEIKEGKQTEREPVYAQTAASQGANDYGDTYVEINLTAQHLFFYKNGTKIVESDFVSGNLSKHYDTPTGVYGLTYKEKDAVLKGENYASPVTYWMPFCNNVGMHDATWRSSFGGNIYKTSGSHGCINLPPAAAQKIFENIEQGDPVLVYNLPGTESASAVAQDAAQVVNLINGIGEVTLESETAIQTARNLYNQLPDSGKAQVTNADLLAACEAQLALLKSQVPQ